MKHLALLFLMAALSLSASGAAAKPAELRGLVTAAKPAGCANYRFLLFNLYRAELWSDASRLPGNSYGLSLTYKTDFSRDELVKTSIEEMARISGRTEKAFATTRRQLQTAFRSVNEGDRFTAWRESAKKVRFFRNGKATGTLSSNSDLFMSIWLGSKTRFKGDRDEMLSGRCEA